MIKQILALFVSIASLLSSPALANKEEKLALDATHILIGKVKKVESYYDVNKWGDELIFSKVTVKVKKKIKGKVDDYVSFVVEGGSVAEITLKVSNYPLFKEDEEIKLYLKKVGPIFHYVASETLETMEVQAKPPKKPGGKEKCCKTFASWPQPNVPYYVNPSNHDVTRACAINDINAGASLWNDVSGINMTYSGTTGDAEVSQNFRNVIFFREAASGSTIAATYTWYTRRGRQIVEFDMIFYDSWQFYSFVCAGGSCNDDGFYIEIIAAHELGHAIGIDHNRCQSSIMYPYADYCGTSLLSPDDTACAAKLYGEN